MNQLVLLLALASLSSSYAALFGSPCTEEEMIEPITKIYKLVDSIQARKIDAQPVLHEISEKVNELGVHLEKVNETCGEEKTESVNKLLEFMENIRKIIYIEKALDENKFEKAKDLIETIQCQHIIQMLIRKYLVGGKSLEKVIELLKIMEDMKIINFVNEAILYVIDESNMSASGAIIPLMKKQILEYTNNTDDSVLLAAKLNMKEMVKISFNGNCYKGFIALSKIDEQMTDQAFYKVIYENVTETEINFNQFLLAPNLRLQVIGLLATYDKLNILNMQNSLIMGKVLVYAKELQANDQIIQEPESGRILANIISHVTVFANRVASGYTCHTYEQQKSLITGKPMEHLQHNEYTVFYSPKNPQIFHNSKFIKNPDGKLLLITAEKTFGRNTVQYSVAIENGDYPKNIHMPGKIISKTVLDKEETTFDELCAMNPKPVIQICSPSTESLNREEYKEMWRVLYDDFEKYIKACKNE